MKDFLPIAKFTYEHEYAVLKTLLEAKEIPYFFKNETMIGLAPFYSNALGGITLFVHNASAEKAKAILKDLNSTNHLKLT